MPDFSAWQSWGADSVFAQWYTQAERADSLALMLGHRGVSVTLVRAGSAQAAHVVMLVPSGNGAAQQTKLQGGVAAREQLLMVGTATLDVQRGDKFKYPSSAGRLNYEVVRVERTLEGMVQAMAEEMQ